MHGVCFCRRVGAFSFGGDDMELWQKIGLSILLGGLLSGAGVLIGFQIWTGGKRQTEYTRDVSQQVKITIQKDNSLPQKLTVTTHESTTKIEKTK